MTLSRPAWPALARSILGRDIGAAAVLVLAMIVFAFRAPEQNAADAKAREEGQ